MMKYTNVFQILAILLALDRQTSGFFHGNSISSAGRHICTFGVSSCKYRNSQLLASTISSSKMTDVNEISPKSVTKEIMAFFTTPTGPVTAAKARDNAFTAKMLDPMTRVHVDGMHIITLLFQSARSKRRAVTLLPHSYMLEKLQAWDREWSERDISTFIYGIRSLECVNIIEGQILQFGAKKISESNAALTSRAIGNALYGLQDITSDTIGANEICLALTAKIEKFNGNLNGQDIGIGLYGLQGMSPDAPEVRNLISVLAKAIAVSEADFDAQALSNSLYGLQSMSSEYPEVLALISAIATKISQSQALLGAQAIGSGLYGLQKLSSEPLEVRTLLATLVEKVEASAEAWDAQAIGNGLFGVQKMKSTTPEVRALLQAISNKINGSDVQLDSKAIGSALYGLHNLNSDVPQVRQLLSVLASLITNSKSVSLTGQGIADSLYGLQGMSTDCPELRSLLSAIALRIDDSQGKLDAQEIGNSLFGLKALSSDCQETRVIAAKLAEKIKRSKQAYLRPQHIARALLGFQRCSADTIEIRTLIKEITKRIAASDRNPMTAQAIADSIFGIQGFSSNVPEVQELVGELAKKISSTPDKLTPEMIGRALFGLQGLTSSASIFEESAIGLDSDEVQFLLSALWDKIKVCKEPFPLSAIGLGLQGLILLNDPIAMNIKQYLYVAAIRSQKFQQVFNPTPLDFISALKVLKLNNLPVPEWIEDMYQQIAIKNAVAPVSPFSRSDMIITSKYLTTNPKVKDLELNTLVDGFRVDMLFRDFNLIIELDGPSHKYPARKRYDAERDEYLSVKSGYKVIRLSTENVPFDDVIANIQRIVVAAQDSKDEEKIQYMYASDSKVQELYSKKP